MVCHKIILVCLLEPLQNFIYLTFLSHILLFSLIIFIVKFIMSLSFIVNILYSDTQVSVTPILYYLVVNVLESLSHKRYVGRTNKR